MRFDYQVIVDLIEKGSRVLDLGCGDGELLALLTKEKDCTGSGLEIDEKAIYKSMAKGISVSHGDIDTGLPDYASKRFDYVILNESIQEILHPTQVLLEALRVGRKVIVGIPNFCHLGARFQFFFKGRTPITEALPYKWYDTPNIRFLSLKDFRDFCKEQGIKIVKEIGIANSKKIRFKKNWFATSGIYLLEKE